MILQWLVTSLNSQSVAIALPWWQNVLLMANLELIDRETEKRENLIRFISTIIIIPFALPQ